METTGEKRKLSDTVGKDNQSTGTSTQLERKLIDVGAGVEVEFRVNGESEHQVDVEIDLRAVIEVHVDFEFEGTNAVDPDSDPAAVDELPACQGTTFLGPRSKLAFLLNQDQIRTTKSAMQAGDYICRAVESPPRIGLSG